MTRNDHLAFCSICHKRASDLNLGIVCSLTQKQAQFVDNCSDFEFDEARENEIRRDVNLRIDKIQSKHKATSEIAKDAQGEIKEEYTFSKTYYGLGLGMGIFIFLATVYSVIQNPEQLKTIWIYFFMVFPIVFSIYSFKKMKDINPQFLINVNGFGKPDSLIKWNNVITAQIIDISSEHSSGSKLVVYCYPFQEIEFDLTGYNGTSEQVAKSFEYFLNLRKEKGT